MTAPKSMRELIAERTDDVCDFYAPSEWAHAAFIEAATELVSEAVRRAAEATAHELDTYVHDATVDRVLAAVMGTAPEEP